jgi:hypothetical protein
MHEFLSAWRDFQTKRGPFLLLGDEIPSKCRHNYDVGWDAFIKSPEFGVPHDSRLHLNLLPTPFMGHLKSASVFLLMLNPGFGPHDCYGEYEVPVYRAALVDNLRQTDSNKFLFLNPRFSWHGGYAYWHAKLQSVIRSFARSADKTYREAREHIQSRIAAIQLVPYHSESFALRDRTLNELRSAQLSRAFVRDVLLPQARRGESLLIVTRAVKHWELPKQVKNVIVYSPAQARSAHLGENSEGGRAILDFLKS